MVYNRINYQFQDPNHQHQFHRKRPEDMRTTPVVQDLQKKTDIQCAFNRPYRRLRIEFEHSRLQTLP